MHRDGTVFRVEEIVRAPGLVLALVQFGFALVYYTVLAIPVTAMLNQSVTLGYWPAMMVLAGNSMLRFTLKYQERISQLIDWPHAIGRESKFVWGYMMVVGAGSGLAAGLWADHLVSGVITLPGLGIAILLAMAEGFWNTNRVGGGRAYDVVEPPAIETRWIPIAGMAPK